HRLRSAGRTAALCQIRECHPDRHWPLARQFPERIAAPIIAPRTRAADAGYCHPYRDPGDGGACAKILAALARDLGFCTLALPLRDAGGCPSPRRGRGPPRNSADPESVDRIPAGRACDGDELRHLAGDLCIDPVISYLQLLLHSADLHVHRCRAL